MIDLARFKRGIIARAKAPSPISPIDNSDDSQKHGTRKSKEYISNCDLEPVWLASDDSKLRDEFVHIGELNLPPGRRALALLSNEKPA
jgi:hypothetical protein